MTVGLCMEDVKIGLATHLQYIRPCTRTDRIATTVTKGGGGLRPNYRPSMICAFKSIVHSQYHCVVFPICERI